MGPYVYDFDAPPRGSADQLTRLLGGKGANLVVMATELGLPVPPGFTITTEACREHLAGRWPQSLDEEVRDHLERLGRLVGRAFGDPRDPLLVSVRSGAPVSMPGMMDTVLNLGLTPATADGLAAATADPTFAADCLSRFTQSYRDVTGADDVPEDPWLQLRAAIEAVFRSWNSDRAVAYRRHEGIADDLGTAVTVQAMVFGNRGADSGTGVLFTRNPSTGEATPYGDVLFGAQGEDVVAGTHATLPLSALDGRLPVVAAELRRHADRLERHFADLCDIEFTVEQGRLWLLQARVGKRSPPAALRMAIDMAMDEAFPLSREDAVRRVAHLLADPPRTFVRTRPSPEPIATGLPASPGQATGSIVTTSDAAEAGGSAGRAVILVRSETAPADVRGMARAAGVLTARGGLASHAAVVARGWGIPAVVGASAVEPADRTVTIGGRRFEVGDVVTIDGSSGEIFAGAVAGEWQATPEADQLLRWAAEHGIGVGAREPAAAVESSATERRADAIETDAVTPDDLLRCMLVRGAVSLDQLAESLRARPQDVEQSMRAVAEQGLAVEAEGAYRLSAPGRLNALSAFEADRAEIGVERSVALLDAFHAFDQRVKEIVTAWQVRDLDGTQALNDHGDAAYDARVLDELKALHVEVTEWMAPLADELRRFSGYRSRLGGALDLAAAGDQRYVASPRVDSYHSVWFELHEDLIRLAGRDRSASDAG